MGTESHEIAGAGHEVAVGVPTRADSEPSTPGLIPPGPGVGVFAAFYDEYVQFVARSLLRLGVPDQLRDDALQEVFLVVARRLGAFAGDAHRKTWVFRIAMNVAKNFRRTARRRPESDPRVENRIDPDSLHSRDGGPLEQAIRVEELGRFYRALGELDDDKRAVFVLYELEQMPMPEIALALDLNPNTAHARLRAARLAMEEAMVRQTRRTR